MRRKHASSSSQSRFRTNFNSHIHFAAHHIRSLNLISSLANLLTMAPKISSALGFHERERLYKNPSILAFTLDVGQNYLDLGDGYDTRENARNIINSPRHNDSRTKQTGKAGSARYTLLSSSFNSARVSVALHAKKFQGISQLCKLRSQRSRSYPDSMSFQHGSNEYNHDEKLDKTRAKNPEYECMYVDVSLTDEQETTRSSSTLIKSRLSNFVSSRSWIKNAK
ncbi:hypothetical protein Plhal304r1_c025g0084461 [Plasmopara halstedii]